MQDPSKQTTLSEQSAYAQVHAAV